MPKFGDTTALYGDGKTASKITEILMQ